MKRSRQTKRNDPCPCGSGKLYRRCCKPSRSETYERQREIALAPPAEPPREPVDEELGAMLEEFRHHAPPEVAEQLDEVLSLVEEAAAYEERQDQIIAAARELEQDRAELAALDEDAVTEVAERLFAGDRFRPLWFTAEEVHQAFKKVGFPRRRSTHAEDADFVQNAILSVMDEGRRQRLARKLLLWLPEYVQAGRYLEARLVQASAIQMLEDPEAANPLLVEMFRHGFTDWLHQVRAQQEELIQQIGLDVAQFTTLSRHDFGAWLQQQATDPEMQAQVASYMASHPLLGEQTAAGARALDQDSLHLLDREDVHRILLSPEEVEPWLAELWVRLAPHEQEALAAAERGDLADEAVLGAMKKAIFEVAAEMAPVVWTPDRLVELGASLEAYRHDLLQAGEKEAATLATSALLWVLNEDEPGASRFLVGLCAASLLQVLIALEEERQALREKDP